VPDIVLRFYGRFVVVDHGEQAGRISLLALNVSFNEQLGAEPHRLLLAAKRRTVATKTTTLPPETVVMQPGGETDRADLALWNLANCRVRPQLGGGFQWSQSNDDVVLADLNELSPETPLDPRHTTAFGGSEPVTAIIDIEAGTGTVGQVDQAPCAFAPLREAAETEGPFDRRLAEFIEVTMSLPEGAPQLILDVANRDGTSGSLAFVTDPDDPTMVTISNLCTSGLASVDEEFASAYEVLRTPPPVPDRLVPVTAPALGRQFPCYKGALVRLEQ